MTEHQSSSDLSVLVDAMGAVAWRLPTDSNSYSSASPSAPEFSGYTMDEWLAPEFRSQHVHPDDLPSAIDSCLAAMSKGSHQVEYRFLCADGSYRWVRETIAFLDDYLTPHLAGIIVDISAEQLAPEGTIDELSKLIDVAPYATAVVGFDGIVHYANQALVDMLDARSHDDLVGREALGFIAAYEHGSVKDTVRQIDRDAAYWMPGSIPPFAPTSLTMMVSRKGRLVEVERSVVGVRFEGQPSLLVMMRDISAERRADRAVKQSRDFLERVLSLIDCGVLLVDGITHAIKLANRPAELLLHYPSGELLGRPVAEMDAKDGPRLLTDVTNPLASGETHQFEMVLKRASGDRFDAEMSVRKLDGTSGDYLLVVRDISDRRAADLLLKQSEERFRQVVNEAPIGIHFFEVDDNQDLILTTSNPAADRILGIPHSDLIGLTIGEAFPNLLGTETPDMYYLIATEGGTWYSHFPYKDGRFEGTYEVNVFQAAPGRVAAMFQDESERILAENIERKHRERLSALAGQLTDVEDQERRHLAEELHDRVSQPLAVARMQLREALAERAVADQENLARAIQLLDEAIVETRAITSELFPPVLYELGLSPAIRWLCEEMSRLHQLECVEDIDSIMISLSDEAKALVFRAARELLMNVVKHAKTSRARVSLVERDRTVVLTVTDNGSGFDSEREQDAGEGFGLFSIRERLANMGGRIDIASGIGQGTTVQMIVPGTPRRW